MTTTATAARFALKADELHLIQDRIRTIVLPQLFQQVWNAETTTDEIAAREAVALSTLVERGFIDSSVPRDPIPSDLSEWLIGAAGTFLSLHMAPAYVFEASSWTRESTVLMVASVRAGFVSLLARSQAVTVDGPRASVADRVAIEFAVLPVENLASEIALAIPSGGRVGLNGASVRIGLAEGRGAISAIRHNDPRLMTAAAARIGGVNKLVALQGLAGQFDAGFELRIVRGDGLPMAMLNYLRGDSGWTSLAVGLSRGNNGLPTPDEVVDEATMTVTPITARSIGTTVVSLLAEILRSETNG